VRLLFATNDLVLHGRCLAGFPLLLTDQGDVEPHFHGFMLYLLTEELSANSPQTWEAYGRRLYDYFMFLNSNDLTWDEQPDHVAAAPLRRYRQWSMRDLRLSTKTINSRLGLIARFYLWAKQQGMIEKLPFSMKETRVSRPAGLLSHLHTSPQTALKYDVTLREHEKPIRILSPAQIELCREAIQNQSHRLLFELMLRTGLRSLEARSFPAKYVPNDGARRQQAVYTIHCDPREMQLKFGKPRIIHVPGTLMRQLWAYRDLERNVLLRGVTDSPPPPLLLNARGVPFARTTVVTMFAELSARVGFTVEAHMLRHSYATYTLRALRRSENFNGDPLLYVRDRMGHSDIHTTLQYLHLLDQLEGELALAHEDYIDKLFESAQVSDA
jgi:integrase/recombinase XerD